MHTTESDNISSSTPASPTENTTAPNSTTLVEGDWEYGGVNYMMIGYMLIGIVGILGNTMVIVVIRSNKEMMKKFANLFFMNQSAIDLMASAILFINGVTRTLVDPRAAELKGLVASVYCFMVTTEATSYASFVASTYNLLALTFERYLEICKPIWHKIHYSRKAAFITMAAVWLFGFVYIFADNFATFDVIDGQCLFNIFPSQGAALVASLFTLTIIYITPITVILVCYVAIIVALRSRVSDESNPRSQFMLRARKNMLKTLLTVLGAFFVCWTYTIVPYTMYRMGQLHYTFWYSVWGIVATVAPAVNSIINPFIYTLRYQEFQRSLKALFGIKEQEEISSTEELPQTVRRSSL